MQYGVKVHFHKTFKVFQRNKVGHMQLGFVNAKFGAL